MMEELAACSLYDQKVSGSNPPGSNSDGLVSITRIDGFKSSKTDKYNQNNKNKLYFRSSSMFNVCLCEFFGHVQWFCSYSFDRLELFK